MDNDNSYMLLYQYFCELNDQGHTTWEALIEEVEYIIEDSLPALAWKLEEWWMSSDAGRLTLAWSMAGWRVDQVDLEVHKIWFSRPAGISPRRNSCGR